MNSVKVRLAGTLLFVPGIAHKLFIVTLPLNEYLRGEHVQSLLRSC